jgi:polyisoprenyl-teichoic acid--peptidoglycan teichoic acid transferase
VASRKSNGNDHYLAQGRPSSIDKKAPAKRRSPWLWPMFSLTAVAVASASAGALFALSLGTTPLMQRPLTPDEALIFGKGERIATSRFQLPALARPVNILVMGTKVLTTDVASPPKEASKLSYQALVNSFEGLSDVMLLIRFNPQTRKLAVLSIPRDTRTYVDGRGVTKINEANAQGGPALSALTVSELLGGASIDRYVRINVQGVEKLINTLGGLTVTVPKDMKYQDDSQHLYINLKAGKQHLNGNKVLQLLRFRQDARGDIGRIERQQMVMQAFSEQALNPMTIARLPQVISVIQSHLDTNLSVEEIAALTGFANGVDRSTIEYLTLPGTPSGAEYDVSYWLPDRDQIETIMGKHFDLPLSTSSVP